MSRPVQRSRRMSDAALSPEQAKAELTRAVIAYALLEAPAAVMLAGVLAWVFAFENGLSEDSKMMWAVGAMLVFMAYAGALLLTVLLPAVRRNREAQERAGLSGSN